MDKLIISVTLGFIGGITRILLGLLKSKYVKNRFNFSRLMFTLIASGIIGIFCSLMISPGYSLALAAGYAGTDFIEGMYKLSYSKQLSS